MNRLKWLIIPFLFIACDMPIDLIDEEVIEEVTEDNFIPIVSINQESQMIDSGASITLTIDIDDQDDFYHYYVWTVDGQIVSDEEEYTFSRTPEDVTIYIIAVTVTDGKGLATDSIVLTVRKPPWTPQPLNIYFFEIGVDPQPEDIIVQYTAIDNAQYQSFLSSTATALTIYNRDNDPDCYRVLGGTL